MTKTLSAALTDFVSRFNSTNLNGQLISQTDAQALNLKLGQILPNWFVEMLTKYPVAGAQIEYPFYEPDGDYDGCLSIGIAKPQDILNETLECYPGLAIKDLGYFCIGLDLTGSGDQFFTTNKKGDDPPVYMAYHDVSDIGQEIEEHGMEKIANSFSDFFTKAKPST